MTEAVIELTGVVKRFGTGDRVMTALDGLDATIAEGRVTGLVGPDGAGKTTLMRLTAGLLRPDHGRIRVFGEDVAREARRVQERIGYMPQRFGLYEDLTVAENLDLYADLHGLTGGPRRVRLDRLIDFAGLGPFARRLAGRLSGGMKQKLGLACTLVSRPKLLILDEPSVGVDPVSRRELWQIVYALVRDGITVLWSTAYLDEAERCDDVILLNAGRVLDSGEPDSFAKDLQGRIVEVRPRAQDRRWLVEVARGLPEVLDAIIKSRAIRLLLVKGTDPEALRNRLAASAGCELEIHTVAPAFEDAFIAQIKTRSGGGPAGTSGGAPRRDGEGGAAEPHSAVPFETSGAATRLHGSPVIEISELSRSFGTFKAVDGVSFRVERGEIFGLLGPNGAGKSTTFKMLCGLLPPSSGSARVLDVDLRRAAAEARERIGYMAQKFSLYGDLTVLQNLRFFAGAYGLGGRRRSERIDWALEEFGLGPFAHHDSRNLPLGYKQRLSLACAILHEPPVLFLDEPTSGVDPLVRRGFWSRINAMAAAGVTVLVTTHFMDEAEYCDRIGIIYRGRLIALGSSDELKNSYGGPAQPEPTLEDAFVNLIEGYEGEHSA